MYYLALKDIKENILQKLSEEYKTYPNQISIRGWDLTDVKLDASHQGLGLYPVNLLANKYCPTHRDVYLKSKKEKQNQTWNRYTGRKIHQVYEIVTSEIRSYLLKPSIIRSFNFLAFMNRKVSRIVDKLLSDLTREINKMSFPPTKVKIDAFKKHLKETILFESKIITALIEHLIASNHDIADLFSEFSRLFPLSQEINLNATPLGLSEGIKPDFLYKHQIIGDIKTGTIQNGQIEPFHKLTLAAYALAYEYQHREPINFGVILNVSFSSKRTVPNYKGSDPIVIDDSLRRAFLTMRDEKFNILKKTMPPKAHMKFCKKCIYHKRCRLPRR